MKVEISLEKEQLKAGFQLPLGIWNTGASSAGEWGTGTREIVYTLFIPPCNTLKHITQTTERLQTVGTQLHCINWQKD